MKLVLRCVIFAVIIGIIIFVLNGIYTVTKTGYIDTYGDSSIIAGFYNEPKGSIDVLIFGTSTMSNGVQPAVLWDEQRFTAYNLATTEQYALSAYYLLMEALKYQQAKVVVLNARWLTTPPEGDEDLPEIDRKSAALHLALDYMKLSDVKFKAALDIASQSSTQKAIDYLIPLLTYHSRNNITEDDFDLSFVSRLHPLKGSCIQLWANLVAAPNMTEPVEEVYDLISINRDYVDKIIKLCKSKGIEVLLLALPISEWNRGQHEAVQQYADDMGVDFLDMNIPAVMDALALDFNTDFASPRHEAISGSSKTSRYVASFLAENYALGRDYPEEVVASFDASYAAYMAYSRVYDRIIPLMSAAQFSDYLQLLTDIEDYIVVISAKDEFTYRLTEQQKAALAALGLNTDFNDDIYRYSFAAVLDSGSVVFEQCSPDKIEYDYTSPDGINISVISEGALVGGSIKSSVLVEDKEYSINWRGFNIVVYSKTTDSVIDSVNFDTCGGKDAFRGKAV